MRLFFAVPIEPEQKNMISNWLSQQSIPDNLKAVTPENYHITLNFLGEVNSSNLSALIKYTDQYVQGIQVQGFQLNLNKCGLFQKAKVMWIAPEFIPVGMNKLAKDIQSIWQSVDSTAREYRPHLTLFRKANFILTNFSKFNFSVPVTRFVLYESRSGPNGLQYKALKSWPLL